MKWITNCHESKKNEEMAALTLGHVNRMLIEGNPEASDKYSVAQLRSFGMIGIYEVA